MWSPFLFTNHYYWVTTKSTITILHQPLPVINMTINIELLIIHYTYHVVTSAPQLHSPQPATAGRGRGDPPCIAQLLRVWVPRQRLRGSGAQRSGAIGYSHLGGLLPQIAWDVSYFLGLDGCRLGIYHSRIATNSSFSISSSYFKPPLVRFSNCWMLTVGLTINVKIHGGKYPF